MTGGHNQSRIAETLSFGQPVGGLIQLGFVVEDLDIAMAEFTERMSAGPWFVIRDFAGVDPVYRGSPALARCDVALGFSGHMQIELIRQLDEHPSVYREKPPEARFGFHHFGIAARDFDVAADSLRQAGHQEAFTAAVPSGGRVVYFDPGGVLPGMIELIEADDGLDQMFGAIYQASVGWDGADPVREVGRTGKGIGKMSDMLKGKVVVITGGSSGIGRGIAFAAQRHGAKCVVIADLTPEPREGGEPTHVALTNDGIDAVFVNCDVTSSAALDAVMNAAREHGGVDLMVCNAGIALPDDGPDISVEKFRQLISVNLEGAALSAQKAISQMKELRKPGSVVFTSSMGGLKGSAVTVGYSATKGAVNLLTASLADAHGPDGIRVNAVCPGLIETDLVKSSPAVGAMFEPMRQRMPLRRLGQPQEVGDVVAWLGSHYSTFVTGVSLPVDGGQTAVI